MATWDAKKLEEVVQKLAELQTEELQRRATQALAPSSPAQLAPPVRVKVKPPTFSGEEGQCVEAFLTRFERVARHNGWEGDAKLLQLQDALTGRAQACALQPSEEETRRALRARFALKPRDARVELATLQFTEAGSSLDDHAQRVKTLTRLAYSGTVVDEAALKTLTLDSFLVSLGSGRLRTHLAALRPRTLEEAVEGAKEYLACVSAPRRGPPAARSFDCEDAREGTPGPGACLRPTQSPTPVLSGAAGEGAAVAALTSPKPDLAGLTKELILAFNAQNGTPTRPQEAEGRGARPRDRRRSEGRPLVCWLCGQAGHYARECPRRHPESLAPRERGQAPK